MRHLVSTTFTLLAALTLFAPACDSATDAASADAGAGAGASEPVTPRSVYLPGKLWGPCGSVECDAWLTCVKGEIGTYCAPDCQDSACTVVQYDVCGNMIGEGSALCPDGVCIRPCVVDAQCGFGHACSYSDGFCVNPGE